MSVQCEPEWRNWQTRQVEGLVTVKVVQVQVLSPALVSVEGFTSMRRKPFFFAFFATGPAVGHKWDTGGDRGAIAVGRGAPAGRLRCRRVDCPTLDNFL